MKKLSLIALAIVVSLSMTSCGNSNAEGKPEKVLSKSIYKNVIVQYDAVWDFHEGMAKVRKGSSYDGTVGFIDTKGNEKVACVYDRAEEFQGGLCAVKKDEKYGFINKKGEVVVPIIYEEVGAFSGALAPVALPKPDRTWDDVWGYVNKTGEVIVPVENEAAGNFSDGLAKLKKKDKVGYINEKGEYVIEPVFTWGLSFSEGLAVVEKSDKEMVIDTKGEIVYVLSEKMTFISGAEYHNGLVPVKKMKGRSWWDDDNVKRGYLDKEGNEAISCIYDGVSNFENGVAYVEKDKRDFYINIKGEEVEAPDEE